MELIIIAIVVGVILLMGRETGRDIASGDPGQAVGCGGPVLLLLGLLLVFAIVFAGGGVVMMDAMDADMADVISGQGDGSRYREVFESTSGSDSWETICGKYQANGLAPTERCTRRGYSW